MDVSKRPPMSIRMVHGVQGPDILKEFWPAGYYLHLKRVAADLSSGCEPRNVSGPLNRRRSEDEFTHVKLEPMDLLMDAESGDEDGYMTMDRRGPSEQMVAKSKSKIEVNATPNPTLQLPAIEPDIMADSLPVDDVKCMLCMHPDDYTKDKVFNMSWTHIECNFWSGFLFKKNTQKECYDLKKVLLKKKCIYCRKFGAVIKCSRLNCRSIAHLSCAKVISSSAEPC